MLKEGSIPASRIGHQWRFFRTDIDEWIRSLRTNQRTAISLIDDDPNLKHLFDEELSPESFEVVAATCGEALTLASQRHFDLVFLELKKATIDTFKQLRAIDCGLPVVVIASPSDTKLVDQTMDIGIFTLMKRPTAGSDITNILASLPFKKSSII